MSDRFFPTWDQYVKNLGDKEPTMPRPRMAPGSETLPLSRHEFGLTPLGGWFTLNGGLTLSNVKEKITVRLLVEIATNNCMRLLVMYLKMLLTQPIGPETDLVKYSYHSTFNWVYPELTIWLEEQRNARSPGRKETLEEFGQIIAEAKRIQKMSRQEKHFGKISPLKIYQRTQLAKAKELAKEAKAVAETQEA